MSDRRKAGKKERKRQRVAYFPGSASNLRAYFAEPILKGRGGRLSESLKSAFSMAHNP